MIGATKEVKKTLYPQNVASKGLTILYVFFIVLTVLQILTGCGIIIASSVGSNIESELSHVGVFGTAIGTAIGIGFIVSGLITIIFLQFLNSRIKITKAAEYYIAKIEQDYIIK